jgi:hypothetical protein
MTTPTEPTAYAHARRAAEHLAEAAAELGLAQGAAVTEREALGAEFGLLRWRAAAVVASVGESLEHVRAARERLP